MKYVITVTKISGIRKVLENHEYKGVIREQDVIEECANIAQRCRKMYKGDMNICLVQHGECGDGSPYCRTLRDMFLPKGVAL